MLIVLFQGVVDVVISLDEGLRGCVVIGVVVFLPRDLYLLLDALNWRVGVMICAVLPGWNYTIYNHSKE